MEIRLLVARGQGEGPGRHEVGVSLPKGSMREFFYDEITVIHLKALW